MYNSTLASCLPIEFVVVAVIVIIVAGGDGGGIFTFIDAYMMKSVV